MQLYLSISCCHRRARQDNPAGAEAPEEWDVISLHSSSDSEASPVQETDNKSNNRAEVGRPTFSEETQPDFRWYCVWGYSMNVAINSPQVPRQMGIHCGQGRIAYEGLMRQNGGGVGGLKFKRCGSYQAAKNFYIMKTEENYKAILAGAIPGPTVSCYTWRN